jgi:ABC-type polysaccharide/polyol phosphate transport system ATPase subunit
VTGTSGQVPPIRLENVGKRYVKYQDAPMLITRALRARTRRTMLWAIRDVTFDVNAGDCIGVIGRNGSGKSTLLRMLAGVTAPTEGLVAVTGRVAPLISVGVGFHPELTGRENVYVNGMVLGLNRRELDRRFDEIVEFSEIPEFIDTPVKFYSSGMFVRLGFAVAVLAEPDVLLVDEVLAVGDLAFQMKCFDRMTEIRQRGTTIVVVSHNLNAIRNMCKRTVVVHDGQVAFDGDTEDAISLFHQLLGEERELDGHRMPGQGLVVDPGVAVDKYELFNSAGQPSRFVASGEEVTLRMVIRFLRDVDGPVFGVNIVNESGTVVYAGGTKWAGMGRHRAGSTSTVDLRVRLPLTTGSYTAEMTVAAAYNEATIAVPPRPLLFYVSGSMAHGIVDLGGSFELKPGGDRPAPRTLDPKAASFDPAFPAPDVNPADQTPAEDEHA